MRVSNYFLFTLRKITKEAKLISHKFMLKAGIIRRSGLGLYNWLPTGIRVLHKINSIIRKELDNIGAIEISMPLIQSEDLWKKSGRLKEYGAELISFLDRYSNIFILSPTNEEFITKLVFNEFRSYKSFPIIFYQINTKFRDELRPSSGVIRSREFIMKDAYSFHTDKFSLVNTYNIMYKLYENIFNRIGLNYKVFKADSGSIGGSVSHEFRAFYNLKKNNIFYFNQKHLSFEKKNMNNDCITNKDDEGYMKNGIEIGHIFQVGKKYSNLFNSFICDKNGKNKKLNMGCYGIGITRSIAAIIEQNHDERGIIWPESISPFQVAIIHTGINKTEFIEKIYKEIYLNLKKNNIDVLFYDLNKSFGIMYHDVELIGIPHILIVGKCYFMNKKIEYRNRTKTIIEYFKVCDLIDFLKKKII